MRTEIELYRLMVLQRLVEERVMMLYRQGQISGSVYTGRGQEGVAAGAGLALGRDDVVCPLNRELACHFARGATVAQVFGNFLGRSIGPTRGRDGNMHFGLPERGIFPLVSMLGDLVPVTVGAALAFKRRKEPRVAMTFLGDGAMSTGDVHEGLNLASVLKVPAVFVIQSNQFAYSTPTAKQMANTNIAERIRGGWSIPCDRVDGTDALLVYRRVRAAVEAARSGDGPQAVECLTLRGHGHAAHDDARYVPDELRGAFADPIERLEQGIASEEARAVRESVEQEIAAGLAEAQAAPVPSPEDGVDGVYATEPGRPS